MLSCCTCCGDGGLLQYATALFRYHSFNHYLPLALALWRTRAQTAGFDRPTRPACFIELHGWRIFTHGVLLELVEVQLMRFLHAMSLLTGGFLLQTTINGAVRLLLLPDEAWSLYANHATQSTAPSEACAFARSMSPSR